MCRGSRATSRAVNARVYVCVCVRMYHKMYVGLPQTDKAVSVAESTTVWANSGVAAIMQLGFKYCKINWEYIYVFSVAY